jgi:tetratricopeptide (TPR) repeat protein
MKYLTIILAIICSFTACKNPPQSNAAGNAEPIFQTNPALKKITADIIKSPKDAELHYQRGQLLHRMQLDTLAIKDYKAAAELDSTKAEYFSAVGELFFENKDLTSSVKWIQKAIAKNPEDQKSRLKIAKMFLYIRKYQNAFEQINIVLRKNPYEPEAYFLKGMIYKDTKDTGKAISSFQSALSASPEYRDAFIQLGLLYSDKKDPIALKYFDNALHLDSIDIFPIFAKGVFYQKTGNLQLAKEEYRHCIFRNQHFIDAYFNMGYILLHEDSVQKALRHYNMAIQMDYANPAAYYNRGVCNEVMDSMKQAIADYRKALTLDSTYKSPKLALNRLKVKY